MWTLLQSLLHTPKTRIDSLNQKTRLPSLDNACGFVSTILRCSRPQRPQSMHLRFRPRGSACTGQVNARLDGPPLRQSECSSAPGRDCLAHHIPLAEPPPKVRHTDRRIQNSSVGVAQFQPFGNDSASLPRATSIRMSESTRTVTCYEAVRADRLCEVLARTAPHRAVRRVPCESRRIPAWRSSAHLACRGNAHALPPAPVRR